MMMDPRDDRPPLQTHPDPGLYRVLRWFLPALVLIYLVVGVLVLWAIGLIDPF